MPDLPRLLLVLAAALAAGCPGLAGDAHEPATCDAGAVLP